MSKAALGVGMLAALCAAAALLLAPQRSLAGERGGITVWEVCTDNRGSLTDGRGDAPDWIEIRNTAEEPVSLAGFALADGRGQHRRAALPEVILRPGEHLVLCASGDRGWDGKYFHLPFRLAARGELLALSGPGERTVQVLYLPPLAGDESCGMTAQGAFLPLTEPTPGGENAPARTGTRGAVMGWVEDRR